MLAMDFQIFADCNTHTKASFFCTTDVEDLNALRVSCSPPPSPPSPPTFAMDTASLPPPLSPSSRSGLRQIPVVCPGHSRPLAEVQYSPVTPDGCFLISACHDKLPMLRRADTGDWIGTFEGHKGAVWSAKVDASAQFAATGSADFSVKFWDALSGDVITTFEHKHVVKSVEFTPDGARLLTAGHEKLLRVFDLTGVKELVAHYKAEGRTGIFVPPPAPTLELATAEQIRKVVVLSDTRAVTGEVDGTICIWDLDTGTKVQQFKVDAGGVMDMEASRNATVLTVAAGKKVRRYDFIPTDVVSLILTHCCWLPGLLLRRCEQLCAAASVCDADLVCRRGRRVTPPSGQQVHRRWLGHVGPRV